MSALRVEVVTDYEAFRSLRPMWNAVLERSDTAVPFLTHEWLCSWWECFGEGAEMLALVVRRGGEAVALAPVMVNRRTRRLSFWANAHSMRANFLLTEEPEESLRAIFATLVGSGRAWRDMFFNYIPEDSATAQLVAALCREAGLRFGFIPSLVSPHISLTGLDWEAYQRQLAHGFRTNLGRRERRWFGRESGRAVLYRDPESVDRALEACRAVSLATWQHERGSSIASTSDLWRFYQSIAQIAAERGWLRIGVLDAGDEPVAFEFNLIYGGVMYNLKVGYRPQWRSCTPGHVLKAFMIRQALSEGAVECDLLGMNEGYKLEWATGERRHTCLCIAGPGLARAFGHWLTFAAGPRLRQCRPAVALKRWLDRRRVARVPRERWQQSR